MLARSVALPGFKFSSRLSFGGDLMRGRRKSARVFDPKRPLHVVLRSSRATGKQSLKRFERKISEILNRQCEVHGVRVYERANAGNHLHFVLRAPSRRALRAFLKAVCGLIARKVTGCERGLALRPINTHTKSTKQESSRPAPSVATPNLARFWDARPFSRVVSWGRDFADLKNYLHLNRVEALGFSRHESRGMLELCAQFGLDPPIA
jgi:REP element-mobilizing transposase RayT